MGFDARRPPDPDLLGECVHCGFCLPACPTYRLWGEEMDSPRGRIHLLSQVADGAPLGGSVATHLDRCLSCMGCVTACPSGVAYDQLIEAARPQVERAVRRPWSERLQRAIVFSVFPHRRRLLVARALLLVLQATGIRRLLASRAVADRLPLVLQSSTSLAPHIGPLERLPARIEATPPARATVGMLVGCVQGVFFSEVNAATARVLAAEGFAVLTPPGQACCGALSGHAGREDEAIRFAKATIATFEKAGVDIVVTNAAGCGSAMKEYARLLREEPDWAMRAEHFAARTRDLTELLAAHPPRAERHPLALRIAYHDACHLAHAQGIREQPRVLLSQIPGIEVVEIPDGELCCGSAGVYNLLHPEAARPLGDQKAAHVASTGAQLLVTTNPGCLMQIRAASERAGVAHTGLHLAQVLDASIRDVALAI